MMQKSGSGFIGFDSVGDGVIVSYCHSPRFYSDDFCVSEFLA